MKILVTGASGFVGSTLCEALVRQGHAVRILIRKTSSSSNLGDNQYETATGDLRDPKSLTDAVQGVDAIYHVAGVVSAVDREAFFEANATGTENLAKAAKQHCPKLNRFVYVSSLAAGGPAKKGQIRLEGEKPEPVSWYGQSKLAGEHSLQNSGLPYVVVRPPAVYGPRDRGMLEFFKLVGKGIRPSLGLGAGAKSRYSFVHVEDLVTALVGVGTTSNTLPNGSIFYVAGEGIYSWDHAMEMIASGLEKKTIKIMLPLFLLYISATWGSLVGKLTGKAQPLNLDKIKELKQTNWTCSNQKIKKEIGFKPSWELELGLAQTAKWYRSQGWL